MAIPFRSNAISGSLTHLVDGTSYLVEGANITITSQSNGQVSIASSGGGGSVAGSDRQIQFNDGGAFGASANLVFDSNNSLGGPNLLGAALTMTYDDTVWTRTSTICSSIFNKMNPRHGIRSNRYSTIRI